MKIKTEFGGDLIICKEIVIRMKSLNVETLNHSYFQKIILRI